LRYVDRIVGSSTSLRARAAREQPLHELRLPWIGVPGRRRIPQFAWQLTTVPPRSMQALTSAESARSDSAFDDDRAGRARGAQEGRQRRARSPMHRGRLSEQRRRAPDDDQSRRREHRRGLEIVEDAARVEVGIVRVVARNFPTVLRARLASSAAIACSRK